ncbi:indole-3-glycerol phosphate synthase TrpC [uncultured Streptococcus sp.]|uniref:indole-3-glycerol phosphate synthase TrpC n=1 Tax=uncultured Streptococcus sp. TaxID=83427 RepID=UPI0027DD5446|nr:indole-3-glycerol phosphate synthase TrpC [uncultured Streptococcus sp.]
MTDSTFLERILAVKEKEVAAMEPQTMEPLRQSYSFYDHVKANQNRIQLIAEVKKASPSLGDINTDVDIVKQAKTYEVNGTAMISVLCDREFFKGDIAYLEEISSQVAIPTLQKDFIIDEKQIIAGRNAGATVVLLIVAALSETRLKELYDFAYSIGMEVLVETHNLEELQVAHNLRAKIIGVNNRNLKTFQTNLETSVSLIPYLKDEAVYISESALENGADVAKIASAYDGILCGTALMTADSVEEKVRELCLDKS